MIEREKYNTVAFSGAKATYIALDATAVANAGRIGPSEENVVDLTVTGHGFLAGPNVMDFNCIFILGSTNYAGLKRIFDIPDANSIRVFSNYTAETPGGTETLRTMYKSPRPFWFGGFEIHLSAASATSEDLTVSRDCVRGATFDTNIYTKNMNGIKDISFKFNDHEAILCDENDTIDLVWANTNARTWTVKFFVREK